MDNHIMAPTGNKLGDLPMWAHRPRTEFEQATYDRLKLWLAKKAARRANIHLPEVPAFKDFE